MVVFVNETKATKTAQRLDGGLAGVVLLYIHSYVEQQRTRTHALPFNGSALDREHRSRFIGGPGRVLGWCARIYITKPPRAADLMYFDVLDVLRMWNRRPNSAQIFCEPRALLTAARHRVRTSSQSSDRRRISERAIQNSGTTRPRRQLQSLCAGTGRQGLVSAALLRGSRLRGRLQANARSQQVTRHRALGHPHRGMSRQLRALTGRLTLAASPAGPSTRAPSSMATRWLSNVVVR